MTELEQIGYDEAMSDVRAMITKALENSQIDIMPASMALRVLLASINLMEEDDE